MKLGRNLAVAVESVESINADLGNDQLVVPKPKPNSQIGVRRGAPSPARADAAARGGSRSLADDTVKARCRDFVLFEKVAWDLVSLHEQA